MRWLLFLGMAAVVAGCSTSKVGPQATGGIVVPTAQLIQGAGQTVLLEKGRPIDVVYSPDGRDVIVKDHRGLVILNAGTREIKQQLAATGGSSLTGLAATTSGDIWFTTAGNMVRRASKGQGGKYAWAAQIQLANAPVGGAPHPCGIALMPGQKKAVVAASRSNQLQILDLVGNRVEATIDVDICPFDVVISRDGRTAWVSCWGGPRPRPGTKTQKSSGTSVEVDVRGVAKRASVVQVDLVQKRILGRVETGLMPCEMVLTDRELFVANANADTVSVIDPVARRTITRVNTKLEPTLLFGAMPNGLCLSPDGRTLFIANGGHNSVAVMDVATRRIQGQIPVGWYPVALAMRGETLWVANAKGNGSRSGDPVKRGVYDFSGTMSRIVKPTADLAQKTAAAREQAGVLPALAALQKGNTAKPAVPVPAKYNEPSKIEHVVYILKENRTYDQIFGTLPQGDGDPTLCTFPRPITPNHHALAEEFVLLDNYYCNGVLSADGHAWAMEGNVTTYFERNFGGWTRSYPFGDDPLAVSTTGFLWDHVLNNGKSFKNFGEFDYAEPVPRNSTFKQIYDDFVSGQRKIRFTQNIGVERARSYTHPGYPGWNMKIPDVLRADVFLEDFRTWQAMPNLTIIYLPQDHTSGSTPGEPTERACMADNDLAVGRIVEALSKSKWWPKMAIFVNEDDPQAGFDHVDGHRSICLVVSPYTRRGQVVSEFYNQTSVIHTICRMLNLPPLNKMVSLSPVMSQVFTNTPNLTPYTVRPNTVPLDELNPPSGSGTAIQQWAARESAKLDLSKPDLIKEDTLNRVVWHSAFGDKPYPKHLAGAHGTGLKARALKLGQGVEEEDED